MNKLHAIIVAFVALLFASSNLNVLNLISTYSGSSAPCKQLNETFFSCTDGKSVTISFSVYDNYNPYYGNFTAIWQNNVNFSTPVDIYGGPCTAQSYSTVVCFTNIGSIPITSGNGTITRTLRILFRSDNFPGVEFVKNITVTLEHNMTPHEGLIVGLYNKIFSNYSDMNDSYNYFCDNYNICNQQLNSNLTVLGNVLSNTSVDINNFSLSNAYSNATTAQPLESRVEAIFSNFSDSANKIMNNVYAAKANIASARNLYNYNLTILSNCSYGNVTPYSSTINGSINYLSNYPIYNTLSGSEKYLNLTSTALDKERSLISSCLTTTEARKKASRSNAESYASEIKYAQYGGPVAAILVAVYAAIKIKNERETRRIRER